MLYVMAGDNFWENPIESGREGKKLTNVHIVQSFLQPFQVKQHGMALPAVDS